MGSRHHAARILSSCWLTSAGGYVEVDSSVTMDWDAEKPYQSARHAQFTIGSHRARRRRSLNIIGVSACIRAELREPVRQVELSGEFTVISEAPRVDDLEARWAVGRL